MLILFTGNISSVFRFLKILVAKLYPQTQVVQSTSKVFQELNYAPLKFYFNICIHMVIVSKAIYKFNVISIKLQMTLFTELEKSS